MGSNDSGESEAILEEQIRLQVEALLNHPDLPHDSKELLIDTFFELLSMRAEG